MRAEVTWVTSREIRLETPYDADFVSALKGAIPARNRAWEPEIKAWFVFGPSRAWADAAIDLLLDFFPDAIVHERPAPAPPPPRPPTTDPDFATLHLLPTAPPELVTAAYKVLAKRCHPDRGGSDDAMQALNLAIERLRERGAA